ncbi:annexin-B12-like [Oppia nitens]|uniref:annexin-B12-like n=1 Tax=Oppia nitens TaxID=1686743 RepID=UPI0023DBB991|nr:annexin-B12-like [Oppia nitens]
MDGTPTIRPSGSFNAERMAAKIQKAIKGIGTDERAIIEVLTTHTNSQRQDIKQKFKTMYGRDLADDLKKDLGGMFEDTCLGLLVPNYQYLVDCLYNAIKKDLNVNCIIDILITYHNWDIKDIKQRYAEKYNEDLDIVIANQFSGDFQRVLRSLLTANRSESTDIDGELSAKEAKLLLDSGMKILGTDEDQFLRILCGYSFPQLSAIFSQYSKLAGHPIETAIANEFSGDLLTVFNGIVMIANNIAYYYAVRLYSCIHGMGTDDETITRILISRSEIDLEDIKDAYKKKYNRKLTDDIADDTGGDYKKLLLRILSPL